MSTHRSFITHYVSQIHRVDNEKVNLPLILLTGYSCNLDYPPPIGYGNESKGTVRYRGLSRRK